MKSLVFYFLVIITLSTTFSELNAKEFAVETLVGTIPFITTWKTDNPGVSADNQITIPTSPAETYNFTVDWGDGTSNTGVSGNITHTYAIAGTYQVSISGDFPRMAFGSFIDNEKILSIDQWGDNLWNSFAHAFSSCTNLDVKATDVPNLSNVTSLYAMFSGCTSLVGNSSFNNWQTGTVTFMTNVFSFAERFNQPIGNWDVSNVTHMVAMFQGASSFDQPLGNWDVGNVQEMWAMFLNATSFNQDIGNWNVSNVNAMFDMFYNATSFDQNLGNWNVSNVDMGNNMLGNVTLSTANYDALLMGWEAQNLHPNMRFDVGNSTYCDGAAARANMIANDGWTITDEGRQCPSRRPFITTWKTDNPGVSADNQVTIPTSPAETYSYTVDWGDGTSDTSVTGDITHTYATPGTYQVSISGDFPHIFFRDVGDKEKILSINQWGDIEWRSMNHSFWGCSNLDMVATDVPDLANVTIVNGMFTNCISLIGNNSINDWKMGTIVEMEGMFSGAELFNGPLDNWNVSNVIDMTGTFSRATSFNQPLLNWDVSKVEEMWDMFGGTKSFNQDIGGWDVGNVLDMTGMFLGATSFDQDLSSWNVSKVTYMIVMFAGATSFDQNLGNWNVSSLEDAQSMFNNVTLSTDNYDALLIGWDNQSLPENIRFGGGNSTYCTGEAARTNIIARDNWSITDGGFAGIKLEDLADQIHLESYTLPTITGTNLSGSERYFTGADGKGNAYAAGTTIYYADFPNYPVQLYIYDSGRKNTSNCTDQEDFLLTLSAPCTPPVADKPEDVLTCERYILPELNRNQKYFTATNAGGKQLRAGDPVFSSQRIYVYIGSGDCYDEHTFTVTINPSLCKIPMNECSIQFPQFITPNGDGFNDKFQATKNPCGRTGLLSVHDRYGRMLFVTHTLENGWDGTHGANPLPETDYWYRFVDSDSGEVSKGHFSLIR